MTNDRWGAGCACKHGGYYNCEDKYTPSHVPKHKWEKCTSVDTFSWGFRRNMKMNETMDLPTIIEVRICDSIILEFVRKSEMLSRIHLHRIQVTSAFHTPFHGHIFATFGNFLGPSFILFSDFAFYILKALGYCCKYRH